MSTAPISRRTRKLLNQHGLQLKKSLGQNFLTDAHVLSQIADAADITAKTGVIEIGPGIGALTEKLAEQAKQVIAVELDQRLIPVLRSIFQDQSHVSFVNADVLKVEMPQLIRNFDDVDEVIVVANLPYYITSPILIHLLTGNFPFRRMVVMIQKEVADRLKASPNTKEYGSISVLVQYYAKVQEMAVVPRDVFFPPPKVDSSVIRFDVRDQPAVQVTDEALFFQIVRASFAKRRKTLSNALHAAFSTQLTKQEVMSLLVAADIDPKRRGETCSLTDFANLTTSFKVRLGASAP